MNYLILDESNIVYNVKEMYIEISDMTFSMQPTYTLYIYKYDFVYLC